MKIDAALIPKVTLNTGEQIPCIGMGTFGSDRFTPDQVSAAVAGAIRCGYRMFDCASCYQNEDQIGEVFAQAFKEGVVERKDLFIMTKVWNDQHREVAKALKKSIKDLQCDYADMYFIHWPFPNYHAPGCDVDSRNPDSKPFSVAEFMDTYRQCEALVREGLIRNIGISNMTIPKLEAVYDKFEIKPAACEIEMHPCFQQTELYTYLKDHDILTIGRTVLPGGHIFHDPVPQAYVSDLRTICQDRQGILIKYIQICLAHQVHGNTFRGRASQSKGNEAGDGSSPLGDCADKAF